MSRRIRPGQRERCRTCAEIATERNSTIIFPIRRIISIFARCAESIRLVGPTVQNKKKSDRGDWVVDEMRGDARRKGARRRGGNPAIMHSI